MTHLNFKKFSSIKNKFILVIFIYFLLFIFFFFNSFFNYTVGNIFFGEIPNLYNVNLAQFFFTQAASPIFGKPVPYAYHQLSRTFFIQGHQDTALAFAYKELEQYPEDKGTYYILGLTLGYMNHEKEAIDAFTKYIQYNPNSWAARNDKAWLQFRIGDINGGLQTMEPVVNNETNPWIQNTYGTLLMNKKRYKEAEQSFMKAQAVVKNMSEETWGKAYPGNDPRIYGLGLDAMRLSIDNNLALVKEAQTNKEPWADATGY